VNGGQGIISELVRIKERPCSEDSSTLETPGTMRTLSLVPGVPMTNSLARDQCLERELPQAGSQRTLPHSIGLKPHGEFFASLITDLQIILGVDQEITAS
jgi:hypothetical protein